MTVQHDMPPTTRSLYGEAVGVLLGSWQRRELRRASRFGECGGLTREDLEDIYQDSALVLLGREFESEEHLRRALHEAVKHRALNTHRDRSRHGRIVEHAYSGQEALEHAAEFEQASDRPVLAEQDQLIVREFLAELTEQEGNVFRLLADGHGWRGAADALGAPRNEIRAAARSCERKRERFALLYTTGRLCGYRAHTIQALTAGETDSAVLARRAHAHLQACARCRIEHGTNGERFRRLFDRDALALLPLPVLVQRLPLFSRIAARANRVAQHLTGPVTGGGGASAKLAVGVASVAIAAGGTIGATQALTHHSPRTTARHHHRSTSGPRGAPPAAPVEHQSGAARTPAVTAHRTHGPPKGTSSPTATRTTSTTSTTPAFSAAPLTPAPTASSGHSGTSGFAYLGVPHGTVSSVPAVHQTSNASPRGGAFSP